MTKEITRFYKKKFQDQGSKEEWIDKETAREMVERISFEEFAIAVRMIKVKAVTWDRLPAHALKYIMNHDGIENGSKKALRQNLRKDEKS